MVKRYKGKVGTKQVDESAISDGDILQYKASSDKLEYISATGVGDMLKATYDVDDNGIVDKAESIDDGAGTTATAANIADAVAKKHTQNTDTEFSNGYGETELKALADNGVYSNKWAAPDVGVKYDGVDQYSSAADDDNLDFGTDDFSIEIYFETGDDVTTLQRVIAKRHGAYGDGWDVKIYNGFLYFTQLDSSSLKTVVIASVAENTKYHLVCSYDRSTEIVTATLSNVPYNLDFTGWGSKSVNNTYALFVASTDGGSLYLGTIYKAKLYNYALSQDEVTARWNNGDPMGFVEPFEKRGASNEDWVTDGSAESGLPTIKGVSIFNTRVTSAVSTERAHTGLQSVKVSADGTANNNFYTRYNVITSNYNGKKLHQEVWVYLPSGQSGFTSLSLVVKNSSIETILDSTTTTDTWVKLEGDVDLTDWAAGDFMLAVRTNSITDPTGFYYYWDDASVYTLGNVADWDFTNGGASGVIDGSGNGNYLIHYNNPIVLNSEVKRDVAVGVGETGGATTKELTLSQKANHVIKQIIAINNSGGARTISIGTDGATNDIVNAYSLASGEEKSLTILDDGRFQSSTEDKDINITVDALAGSGVDFIIIYEKL